MSEKVLVAMSGGVDSTVAVLLLKNEGYEVEGATIELEYPKADKKNMSAAVKSGKKAAAELGIKHYVFNFYEEFSQYVKKNFVSEYASGRTPNPCVRCNKYIKFGLFFDRAAELGFDYIATGHYARVKKEENGLYSLYSSAAGKKDQTYVLYNLGQRELSRLLLPLGSYCKQEIRVIAAENGLSAASASDSLEICFIPENNHVSYLLSHGASSEAGDFTDASGNILGRHSGIINYTVGQRKGLGVTFGEPRYVISLDSDSNTVLLGTNDELFEKNLIADSVNWLSGKAPELPFKAGVKIRYGASAAPATLFSGENGTVSVEFDTPQRAVTPGQSAVFYDGERLLGGGIIIKSMPQK